MSPISSSRVFLGHTVLVKRALSSSWTQTLEQKLERHAGKILLLAWNIPWPRPTEEGACLNKRKKKRRVSVIVLCVRETSFKKS